MDAISEHKKDKKVTENAHCGFIMDKLGLTNLTAFGDNMTGSVDKGRTKHDVYFDFSIAFNTVSCNITAAKLMIHRLDKWMIKWIENWLDSDTLGCEQLYKVQLVASYYGHPPSTKSGSLPTL